MPESQEEFETRIKLGSMPISQLRLIASNKGIHLKTFMDKEDIVRLIMFGNPGNRAFNQ